MSCTLLSGKAGTNVFVVFVRLIIVPFLLPLHLRPLCGIFPDLWGVPHYANRSITLCPLKTILGSQLYNRQSTQPLIRALRCLSSTMECVLLHLASSYNLPTLKSRHIHSFKLEGTLLASLWVVQWRSTSQSLADDMTRSYMGNSYG